MRAGAFPGEATATYVLVKAVFRATSSTSKIHQSNALLHTN